MARGPRWRCKVGIVVPRLWVPRPTRAPRSFNFQFHDEARWGSLGSRVSAKCGRLVQERGGAVEIKSEVRVGTAVRMMMLPVSRPADGDGLDLSNSIATFSWPWETEVSTTDRMVCSAPATQLDRSSFRRLQMRRADHSAACADVVGCDDKRNRRRPRPPPPVTVAQPVKRTVTDWDEFTGRFEAIEEVQVRARVGGFVNSVEFTGWCDRPCWRSALHHRSAPVRGGRVAGRGSTCDARAKEELAKRELDAG